MNETKAIAMIPARIGSTRLKMKNLALIGGKPMIAWAIEAAREAGAFDAVVVNADHEAFAPVAERYGADFYLRPAHLGRADTKSDDVVADFMRAVGGDIVAWVNSITPFQPASEIRAIVDHFRASGLDSLITVEDKQVHCLAGGKPVNFTFAGKFAQTQDLTPVRPFVYSLMMWRSHAFLADMAKQGHAFFCGRFEAYAVGKLSGIMVKTEEDLLIVDAIARSRAGGTWSLEYDSMAAIAESKR